MEFTETDASLAGTVTALTKVLSLVIAKLRESEVVDAAWIAETRENCSAAFVAAGGDTSAIATNPGLNSAHAAVTVLFSAAKHQGG